MTVQTFDKNTDKEETIKVESALLFAVWRSASAICGQKATFEIGTAFVGYGAQIEVIGKTENGEKLGTIKGIATYNHFFGEFEIPDDLELGDEAYFEVKLSKHSLKGESDRIPVRPAINITDLKWSAEQARRGDLLTLSGKTKGIHNDEEVLVTIYEYDTDGAHDKIVELPATVKDKQFELQWEYQYFEDTDEIPTQAEQKEYGGSYNPPEYFFTVRFGDAVFGKGQESGLLTFKDFVDVAYADENGLPYADADYKLILADGCERTGKLDSEGRARIEDVPPGQFKIIVLS